MDLKLSNYRYEYLDDSYPAVVADTNLGLAAVVMGDDLKLIVYGFDLAPLGSDFADLVPVIILPANPGINDSPLELRGFTTDRVWCECCRIFLADINGGGFEPGPLPEPLNGWEAWRRHDEEKSA